MPEFLSMLDLCSIAIFRVLLWPWLMPETEIRSRTCDRRGDSLNVVLLPDCVTIPPQ